MAPHGPRKWKINKHGGSVTYRVKGYNHGPIKGYTVTRRLSRHSAKQGAGRSRRRRRRRNEKAEYAQIRAELAGGGAAAHPVGAPAAARPRRKRRSELERLV